MRSLKLVVVGTLASNPYAGMAWMHMQITAGLRRLGHDVYYVEATSVWPDDPIRQMKVNDSDYAVPYLARVAENFGLGDRWAYRRRYSDKEWFGLSLFSTCGNESYVGCLSDCIEPELVSFCSVGRAFGGWISTVS